MKNIFPILKKSAHISRNTLFIAFILISSELGAKEKSSKEDINPDKLKKLTRKAKSIYEDIESVIQKAGERAKKVDLLGSLSTLKGRIQATERYFEIEKEAIRNIKNILSKHKETLQHMDHIKQKLESQKRKCSHYRESRQWKCLRGKFGKDIKFADASEFIVTRRKLRLDDIGGYGPLRKKLKEGMTGYHELFGDDLLSNQNILDYLSQAIGESKCSIKDVTKISKDGKEFARVYFHSGDNDDYVDYFLNSSKWKRIGFHLYALKLHEDQFNRGGGGSGFIKFDSKGNIYEINFREEENIRRYITNFWKGKIQDMNHPVDSSTILSCDKAKMRDLADANEKHIDDTSREKAKHISRDLGNSGNDNGKRSKVESR